jgi:hypothetical protein
MRRLVVAGALALTLCGCGDNRGAEDFAITVKRPITSVFTAIGTASLPSEVHALFPQLKVERTRPSDNEVLYTIPGDGAFPATIRFRFEAAEGGRATMVHAFVDVPAIKVQLGGKPMVLSEGKVERALNLYLKHVAQSSGSSGGWGSSPMPETLLALAIATNSKVLAEFQDMEKHPEKYNGRLASLGDVFGDESDDYDAARDAETVDNARPQSNPDRDVARAQMGQWEQRAREEEARNAASQPMNEAKGADVTPGKSDRSDTEN